MAAIQSKISKITAVLLLTVAVFVDVTQWVVGLLSLGIITAVIVWIVNGFINIVAWLGFYFWFSTIGISFVSPKKVLTMAATVLGDTIAGGYLPAWIICILFMISLEKAEGALAHIPGGDVAIKAAAAAKMAGKPPVLPKGPPPLPKGPPSLPPRPGEPGYGAPVAQRAGKLRQDVANFQNRARTAAQERAEGLRQHAEKYREDIEREIKDYGAGGDAGR